MQDIRFSVYEHCLKYKNGAKLRRQFIVLKDEDGNIIGWTDFHKYAAANRLSKAKSIFSDTKKRSHHIVKLLNYVFFEKYHIEKLTDIEVDMVKNFLQDYGMCTLQGDDENTHRSKTTVEICVSHIIDFIDLLTKDKPSCKMRVDQLYETKKIFNKNRRRYEEKKIPIFDINFKPSNQEIFRDIPEGVFRILIDEIAKNHTRILMIAAFGAFAGMRPAECCNVRRTDSKLGPGLRFEMVNGEVTNVFIDLKEEKVLRSDGISVGDIKKPREQKVYHAFLEAFMDCYNKYMEYIVGKPYETEYGALTNTSFGKAYTYDAYYKEFKKVVDACIPKMLESDDAKTVNYGHLIQEHSLGPHIFRHWFSVKLTLYGEDVAGLMHWRGDKSPESALTYLQNKGDLEKEYNKVSAEIFDYNLWRADKIHNGGNE